MTQVSRYGHMLKVTVGRMRMRVTARYRVTGSVLDDTVQGEMLGADTVLELDSPDPPDRVARLLPNAGRCRFVMPALSALRSTRATTSEYHTPQLPSRGPLPRPFRLEKKEG